MRHRLVQILSVFLLIGCSQMPLSSTQPVTSPSLAPIIGTESPILPGSKGDRSHLASLEVQLRLPLPEGFSVAQLSAGEAGAWTAELDGAKAARLRLSAQQNQGDEQVLTFVLEALTPLTSASFHELVFYSAEGIVQTAALLPELPASRLDAALTSESLANWMILKEHQRGLGKTIHELSPETFAALKGSAEVAELARQLKDLYRQSRGKADPLKSEKAQASAKAASQKLNEKAQAAASSQGKPATVKPDEKSPKPDKGKAPYSISSCK